MGDVLTIRTARTDDAAALLGIYAPYVRETAITFEYDVPSKAEFAARISRTLARYPYLVAERGGEAVGYAYTGAFKEHKAYDWSVETSIYVRMDSRRTGAGRALSAALEAVSRAQGVTNLNACIAVPDEARGADSRLSSESMEFHAHIGYQLVGRFHKCGHKFGTWYDMVWMEKMLGSHPDAPAPVMPFPELGAAALAALGIAR